MLCCGLLCYVCFRGYDTHYDTGYDTGYVSYYDSEQIVVESQREAVPLCVLNGKTSPRSGGVQPAKIAARHSRT